MDSIDVTDPGDVTRDNRAVTVRIDRPPTPGTHGSILLGGRVGQRAVPTKRPIR